MTQGSKMTILWVDDDGLRRFRNEQRHLERAGWQVTWAEGVQEAVDALATSVFFAVLLDQTLPMGSPISNRANVWQGCLLLHWLRGRKLPSQAPEIGEWKKVSRRKPLLENQLAKMILVSGYFDRDVDAAIRIVEPDLISMVKPIDAEVLAETLRQLREG